MNIAVRNAIVSLFALETLMFARTFFSGPVHLCHLLDYYYSFLYYTPERLLSPSNLLRLSLLKILFFTKIKGYFDLQSAERDYAFIVFDANK